jgi:hypothetical protein
MIRYFPALGCVLVALALGGCWQTNEYPYAQYIQSNCTSPRQACWYANEYPGAQYAQRTQTIAMGAGNDQQVNAATQVIDPWNRNVGNSRIPGNGDRTVNARLCTGCGGCRGYRGRRGSRGSWRCRGCPGSRGCRGCLDRRCRVNRHAFAVSGQQDGGAAAPAQGRGVAECRSRGLPDGKVWARVAAFLDRRGCNDYGCPGGVRH